MDDKEAQAKYYSNGKVMLCSTVLLFLMVIILVFLHTCRYSCFRRRRHHQRHVIRTDSSVVEGLRPSVLKFLHTFTYSSATHAALHDCAVCLSEFADGEEGRVLPNCNHAFHSNCIDAWFRSHSNCPLCRTTVHRLAEPVQLPRSASSDAEPVPVSFSYFPEPVRCPRKPLELVGAIVDLESGHGPRISQVDN